MRELITFPIIIIIKIHHDHNNHDHNSHLMRELIAGSISIHRREKDPGRSGWVDWRFFSWVTICFYMNHHLIINKHLVLLEICLSWPSLARLSSSVLRPLRPPDMLSCTLKLKGEVFLWHSHSSFLVIVSPQESLGGKGRRLCLGLSRCSPPSKVWQWWWWRWWWGWWRSWWWGWCWQWGSPSSGWSW